MLWVRTFSVFLPSLTSSSAVWANPSEGQNPRNAANKQTFLIIAIPCRKPQFLICISNPRIVRFSYPRYNELTHGLSGMRAGIPSRVTFRFELAGAVELLLFLGVVHFGVEINLGNL